MSPTWLEIRSLLRVFAWTEAGAKTQVLIDLLIFPSALLYLALRIASFDLTARNTAIAGTVALSLGSAVNRLGYRVLEDRFAGRLFLLHINGVDIRSYYFSNLGVGSVYAMGISSATLLGAAVFLRVDLSFFGGLLAFFAMLLVAVSMAALGNLMAIFAPNFLMGATGLNLLAIGMTLLSPVFFSIELLPSMLQGVASLSPYYQGSLVFRAVLNAEPISSAIVFRLVVTCVALTTVSFLSTRRLGR